MSFSVSVNAYLFAILVKTLKLDLTVDNGKQSIVRTSSYVIAGMNFCSALSYQNITGKNKLTVGALNTKSLGLAVTAVLGGTHTFFMSEKL